MFAALSQVASTREKERAAESLSWIENLGNGILSMWAIPDQSKPADKDFFVGAVEAVQSRIQGLETGSGWLKDEGLREELDLAWARNQLLEIIYVLQIMLKLLESKTDLARSDAFLAWFRFVGTCGFFENFEPVRLQLCAF